MAHLVRYEAGNLAPSVTFRTGSGAGAVNRPDDVMLVSTLLNWSYQNSGRKLPRGAKRIVVAGPKFTPEMKLFLTDAQSFYYSPSKANGIASPLPLQSTSHAMLNYIVFELFRAVGEGSGSDEAVVIDALSTVPYPHHLRSRIMGSPLPEAGSESGSGGIPLSESGPASTH